MTETNLERSIVRAPMDGDVLQVKIHPGEFAPAGVTPTPLILLGRLKPLHIRVDVDEHEAWRVRPEAKATAAVRGNANLKAPLTFVRFEPFVVPKKSLTGDSTERVDTRVLQVIYRVEGDALPLFVGQQMDVFIDGSESKNAMTMKCGDREQQLHNKICEPVRSVWTDFVPFPFRLRNRPGLQTPVECCAAPV